MIEVRQTEIYVQRGPLPVILLAGGDKRTQSRDIQDALALAERV